MKYKQEEKGNSLDKEVVVIVDFVATVDRSIGMFRKVLLNNNMSFLHEEDKKEFDFFADRLEEFQEELDDIYDDYIYDTEKNQLGRYFKPLTDLSVSMMEVGRYIKSLNNDGFNDKDDFSFDK